MEAKNILHSDIHKIGIDRLLEITPRKYQNDVVFLLKAMM